VGMTVLIVFFVVRLSKRSLALMPCMMSPDEFAAFKFKSSREKIRRFVGKWSGLLASHPSFDQIEAMWVSQVREI
jgi:hypothetical protein